MQRNARVWQRKLVQACLDRHEKRRDYIMSGVYRTFPWNNNYGGRPARFHQLITKLDEWFACGRDGIKRGYSDEL